MLVALTIFKDEIAPCFEAAKRFQVLEIEDCKIISEKYLECQAKGPIARLRLLKEAGIDVVICNGIRSFYKDMLEAENRTVYKDVTGKIKKAIELLLKGDIGRASKSRPEDQAPCLFEMGELVQITGEYFARNGYEVSDDEFEFPVDLLATIKCPKCRKPIRVAICCGGHLFSWEKEIKELRSILDNFDAAVYVHAAQKPVARTCRDYKINLLDPWILENEEKGKKSSPLPILRLPVKGHKKAYKAKQKK